MIEEPASLTLYQNTPRPTDEQIKALSGYPTGFIVDAMNGVGALPYDIRPLAPGELPDTLCGPVVTASNRPTDLMATLGALTQLQQGDILLVATGHCTACAAIGDRVIGMAKNAGAAGVVTDGLVRDIQGIINVGIPVFCAGVSPNSPHSKGPGSVQSQVVMGDVVINAGDILISDRDGAVIVPLEQVDAVVKRLPAIAELEEALDREVSNGLAVPESVLALLESDGVVFVNERLR